MKIITRSAAIGNLKEYIGKDLLPEAKRLGITVFKDGKQNKGWKGMVLERLAGLTNNSSKAPNGLTYEIKSVSFHTVKGFVVPKETMAITMINGEEVLKTDFYKSHCWAKLKSLVFCSVNWEEKFAKRAVLLGVASLDFAEDDLLIKEIKADYEEIREKIRIDGYTSLSGRMGKWIQPRPKGAGHGSKSRAFYARKRLVSKIFEIALVD